MQVMRVWSLGQEDPLEEGSSVFIPGKSHGQRSLVGYSPWGHKESDMTLTEHTHAIGEVLARLSHFLSVYELKRKRVKKNWF